MNAARMWEAEARALRKRYDHLRAENAKLREASHEAGEELERERQVWAAEVKGEKLAGNIVKERYAVGVVHGIQIGLSIFRSAKAAVDSKGEGK